MANLFLTGSGLPTPAVGEVTDYYRDTGTNLIYYRSPTGWEAVPSLIPTPDGVGTTWYHGDGSPNSGLGAENDYYRDELDGTIYRKHTVHGWVSKGSLDFIGVYGVQWGEGSGAPANTPSLNNLPAGSFYLDVVTSNIYYKDPSLTWSLKGQLGSYSITVIESLTSTATAQAVIATAQAAIATDNAALTAADAEQTALDVVATNANAAQTAADRVQTGIDREEAVTAAAKTAADVITTANNVETSNTNITTANNLLAAALVRASYATIALGLAAVATNDVFLVRPNVTDGLTRFSWYTKTGASTYTFLSSVVNGAELDSTGLANLIATILPLPKEVLSEGMRFRIGNRLYADFSSATGFTFHKINLAASNTFLSDLPTIALSERVFNGALGSMFSALLPEVSPEGIRYRIGNRLYAQLDAIDGLTVHKAKLSATKTYLDDQPTVAIADRIFNGALGTMFNSLADELGGVLRFRWGNRLLAEWDMIYGFKPSKAMLPTSTVLADSPTTSLVSRLAPAVDITKLYAWGDSRTAGAGDSIPYRFPEFLAALVSPMTSVNKGIGGQTSIMISARQGGWPLLLSVASDTIPASGAVAVTAYSTDIFNSSGTPLTTGSHTGTLAGIAGTYTSDGAGGLTFTRTTAGTAVSIKKYSPFIPDAGVNNRNKINFICIGTNNAGTDNITGATGSTYDNVRYAKAMFDYVLTGGGLPIVAGVIDNNPTTTANTVDCVALNNQYKSIFGRYYVDFFRPPTAEELATANAAIGTTYSFTSNDNTDIAAGKWPRGLYADSVHFLRHGQYIQALRVQRHLIRLGIIV